MFNWILINKNLHPHEQLQRKFRQKLGKLEKYLQSFPPDAVHLQIKLEKHSRKPVFTSALTLRLPPAVLRSEKRAADPVAAFDDAVKVLLREVAGLKSRLRREAQWKRGDRRAELRVVKPARFAEQPITAGVGPRRQSEVLRAILDRYYVRVLHHVRRQLLRDELAGDVPPGAIDARAVVDEAARRALVAPEKKADPLSYRLWLYLLARRELQRRYKQLREQAEHDVPVEATKAIADEAETPEGYIPQQPREIIEQEIEPSVVTMTDVMADNQAPRPDEIVTEHELIDYFQRAASNWPEKDRAVFELHFLEGFEADEVAMLEKMKTEQVSALIENIQARLRDLLREATATSMAATPKPVALPKAPRIRPREQSLAAS